MIRYFYLERVFEHIQEHLSMLRQEHHRRPHAERVSTTRATLQKRDGTDRSDEASSYGMLLMAVMRRFHMGCY